MSITETFLIISIILSIFLYYVVKIIEYNFKKNIMIYVISLFLITSIAIYSFIYFLHYDGCGDFIFIFTFAISLLLGIFTLIEKLYKRFKTSEKK